MKKEPKTTVPELPTPFELAQLAMNCEARPGEPIKARMAAALDIWEAALETVQDRKDAQEQEQAFVGQIGTASNKDWRERLRAYKGSPQRLCTILRGLTYPAQKVLNSLFKANNGPRAQQGDFAALLQFAASPKNRIDPRWGSTPGLWEIEEITDPTERAKWFDNHKAEIGSHQPFPKWARQMLETIGSDGTFNGLDYRALVSLRNDHISANMKRSYKPAAKNRG